MAIRVEHGRPETIIAAAKRAGEAQASLRAQQQAEGLQIQQQEFDYRTTLRQQDIVIDLQMQERAKLWEIQKMELRSQGDFAREERKRMRALDEYDATIKYIGESDWIDDSIRPGLEFKAKMKLLNQGVSDRTIFPELYERQTTERPPSPTQRMSAMKMLEDERFEEPTGWRKYAPSFLGGKEPVSESDLVQKQILEGIVAGKPNVPSGTISPVVPKTDYSIGETLIRNGIQYKVTGFDTDGMPMIEKL